MDIEGFELEALRGASGLLRRHSVWFLLIECNVGMIGEAKKNDMCAAARRRLFCGIVCVCVCVCWGGNCVCVCVPWRVCACQDDKGAGSAPPGRTGHLPDHLQPARPPSTPPSPRLQFLDEIGYVISNTGFQGPWISPEEIANGQAKLVGVNLFCIRKNLKAAMDKAG